jgi:hypothetical protein
LTQESDVVESHKLGRRERQIVEAVDRVNGASVADVRRALPEPQTHLACLDRRVTLKATTGCFACAGWYGTFWSDRPSDAAARFKTATLQASHASRRLRRRLKPEGLQCCKTRIEHAEARS